MDGKITVSEEVGLDDDALSLLRARITGGVLRDGDAGYDEARSVWNGMVDARPALIVRCLDTADVVSAVSFARAAGLGVSVRGGGHNVAGTAIREGGVVVDLSGMKSIDVDPEGERLGRAAGARSASSMRPPRSSALRHRSGS